MTDYNIYFRLADEMVKAKTSGGPGTWVELTSLAKHLGREPSLKELELLVYELTPLSTGHCLWDLAHTIYHIDVDEGDGVKH